MTLESIPCTTLLGASTHLRRPFTPHALRWKLENGIALPYIDRGLVVDRLNVVVPDLWEDAYEPLDAKHLLCRLTVAGVSRQDVGEGDDPKERYTDALKRAAVKFGIGAYLLRLPCVRVRHHTITPGMLGRLRTEYAAWLTGPGRVFGEPIDHGPSYAGDERTTAAPARAHRFLSARGSLRPECRDELLLALLGPPGRPPRFSLREIRGMIAATNVPGLPVDLTRDQARAAIDTLSDQQAERLRQIIEAKAER